MGPSPFWGSLKDPRQSFKKRGIGRVRDGLHSPKGKHWDAIKIKRISTFLPLECTLPATGRGVTVVHLDISEF